MALVRRAAALLRFPSVLAFAPGPAAADRYRTLCAAFYGYLAAFALGTMTGYRQVADATPAGLLWPLAWASALPWRPVAIALLLLLVASALVALVGHRHRGPRVAAFVALLLWVAAVNSFGKVNHGLHHLLIPAFFLALSPSPRDDRDPRPYPPLLAAQAVVLLTYTSSGAFKLVEGVRQALAGGPSIFGGASLATIVADRALQTAEQPPLAGLIVGFPRLSSLLFLATALVELTAVAAVLAPRLAAVWAVALMSFHLAVFWSMHIGFAASIAVLALLFLWSPFLVTTAPEPAPPPSRPPDRTAGPPAERDGEPPAHTRPLARR